MNISNDTSLSLTGWQKGLLFLVSFFIVAFGQPAWNEFLSLLTGALGFACFWRLLLSLPSAKYRFFLSLVWYGAVQVIQLSWFLAHPYLYIYGVVLFCAVLMGTQFGIIAIWIRPKTFCHLSQLFALAGLWILFEWSRLFILSGLPFNPVGLALSGSLYSLQLASIAGIYGLSFVVFLTNLLILRAWLQPRSLGRWVAVSLVVLFPYLFGWVHYAFHHRLMSKNQEFLSVVLVQSALPIEENLTFQSAQELRDFVMTEWKQVFSTLRKQVGKKIDLILMPEYIVPFGTFHSVFPIKDIEQLFREMFAYSKIDRFNTDDPRFVSNASIVQTLANFFHAHVVVGLEDSVYLDEEKTHLENYSSAFHFTPGGAQLPVRYEKQVLVPMGEYIPFEWCRTLAAKYGISGSFTCGKGAKIFNGPIPFGASICYEEIYGNLMRQNRLQGAQLLANLTNDGWYPHSRLPKQHFDHARLRTVENGIPLIRACNTGITGGIDSLGQIIGTIEGDELTPNSILLDIPLYHYRTVYTHYGDLPILAISCLSLLFLFLRRIFQGIS